MTDTHAAEAPVETVPPAPEAAEQAAAPALPEIEHPIGPVRQGVLDHLLDSEGPQTVAQIIAGLGNHSRNTVESAIKREFNAGRIERVAPGTYRLAPAKPLPPPSPEPPPPSRNGHSNDEWIALIEAWQADPTTWNVEEDGPPPNDPNHRIPLDVVGRFKERIRKREERRKDAEVAAARQDAADAELRNKLLAATGGNYTLGPGIEDLTPIKAAMELVPLDIVCRVISWKVNKLCFPKNPTLTTWRDRPLLTAVAEEFCASVIVARSVDAWSAAGTAPGKATSASEPSSRKTYRRRHR
jgi:hypothetical protein